MGYYSNVCIALTPEGYEQFKKNFNEYFEETKEDLVDHIKNYFIKEAEKINKPKYIAKNGAVLLKYDNYKWYENDKETFPEITGIMKSLSELDETDYFYLRSGEDYGDNDEMGNYYDNPFEIGIVKTIECRLPKPQNYHQDEEDNRMTM